MYIHIYKAVTGLLFILNRNDIKPILLADGPEVKNTNSIEDNLRSWCVTSVPWFHFRITEGSLHYLLVLITVCPARIRSSIVHQDA